jgi:hypothetical protein
MRAKRGDEDLVMDAADIAMIRQNARAACLADASLWRR